MVDPRLIEAAHDGDAKALARLLEASRLDLGRYARRVCATEDVDDSVQDALVIVYRKLGTLRAIATFSGWIYQIVKRACQRRWRRRAMEGDNSELLELAQDPVDFQLRLDLSQIISVLTPEYRQVIVMRDLNGLTAEEAAVEIGVSVETVKSRLHRARLVIRQQLA